MATSKKTVGLVLSGCGFLDGSEIHEATLTLLALDRRGASVVAMAPRMNQADVVDHEKGKPSAASRDVLAESARIVRGKIEDIERVAPASLDALIFPGGYGAAKNLCTFAKEGKGLSVQRDVQRLIVAMHAAKKPLGFICIAPVIAAKVLGHLKPRLTIGRDADTAAAIEALGARHVARGADEIVTDEDLKIVTTPAYMLAESIAPVERGIDALVAAVLALA